MLVTIPHFSSEASMWARIFAVYIRFSACAVALVCVLFHNMSAAVAVGAGALIAFLPNIFFWIWMPRCADPVAALRAWYTAGAAKFVGTLLLWCLAWLAFPAFSQQYAAWFFAGIGVIWCAQMVVLARVH